MISLVIGLSPPLHRTLFASTQDGGWLNGWLTSSLENIGCLFTSLQMFVVGAKLSDSFTATAARDDAASPQPPKKVLAFIFLLLVVWG